MCSGIEMARVCKVVRYMVAFIDDDKIVLNKIGLTWPDGGWDSQPWASAKTSRG